MGDSMRKDVPPMQRASAGGAEKTEREMTLWGIFKNRLASLSSEDFIMLTVTIVITGAVSLTLIFLSVAAALNR